MINGKALYVCESCLERNKACVIITRERSRKDAACSACRTGKGGCKPSNVLKTDYPPNIALEDNASKQSTDASPVIKNQLNKTASSSRVTQQRALLDNGESSGVSDHSRSVNIPDTNSLVNISPDHLNTIVSREIANQMSGFKKELTGQLHDVVTQIMTTFKQEAVAAMASASVSNTPRLEPAHTNPGVKPARTTPELQPPPTNPSLASVSPTNAISSASPTHDDGVPESVESEESEESVESA